MRISLIHSLAKTRGRGQVAGSRSAASRTPCRDRPPQRDTRPGEASSLSAMGSGPRMPARVHYMTRAPLRSTPIPLLGRVCGYLSKRAEIPGPVWTIDQGHPATTAQPECKTVLDSAKDRSVPRSSYSFTFVRPRASPTGSAGRFLDGFHVVVAIAQVVADLLDQDVAHDVSQVLLAVAPVVEERRGRSFPPIGRLV